MRIYDKPSPISLLYLVHHGIKDQRWGIQNGPPYPLKTDDRSTPTIDYDKINLSAKSLPTIRLPIQEYAHIMSEVATHISNKQRQQSVFRKNIGQYSYTFENRFDGTYRVIGKDIIADDIYDYYEGEIDDD